MESLKYITRGMVKPFDMQKVYFTAHKDDYHLLDDIAKDILSIIDVAIFYGKSENKSDDFKLMKLLVIPVTKNFLYEEKLPLGDSFKLPDFTIRDAASGLFVIWEHLGMLGDEEYRKAWEAKKQVYEANGFSEKNGNLIVTMDSLDGGIDCQEIQRKINEYLG